MAAKPNWTILTYIAAHNNLEALGIASYQQIRAVGSTSQAMHAVLYDGPQVARRYIFGDPENVLVEEDLGDFDSGDPDRLLETVKWVFEQYPADHYGLILWSHGTGWEPEEIERIAQEARGDQDVNQEESINRAGTPGSYALFRPTLTTILKQPTPNERAVLFDDGSQHSVDTIELGKVTTQIQKIIGQPLDLLGMDACLMATLEVAYQVQDSTRFLVASEELVPGHSWPYDIIFSGLRAEPTLAPRDFAARAVREYVRFYAANPPSAGDVTKVALDLSQINTLSTATDNLAQALIQEMASQADVLWQAQVKTRDYETRNGKRKDNKFDFHLWDLGSLSGALAANPAASAPVKETASALQQALAPGAVVVDQGHYGKWFDGIGGTTAYLIPPGVELSISPYYREVEFAKASHWGKMIKAYHEHYR